MAFAPGGALGAPGAVDPIVAARFRALEPAETGDDATRRVMCEYIWITRKPTSYIPAQQMRSKTRVVDYVPGTVEELPVSGVRTGDGKSGAQVGNSDAHSLV
jgi:hypothetical protein